MAWVIMRGMSVEDRRTDTQRVCVEVIRGCVWGGGVTVGGSSEYVFVCICVCVGGGEKRNERR